MVGDVHSDDAREVPVGGLADLAVRGRGVDPIDAAVGGLPEATVAVALDRVESARIGGVDDHVPHAPAADMRAIRTGADVNERGATVGRFEEAAAFGAGV